MPKHRAMYLVASGAAAVCAVTLIVSFAAGSYIVAWSSALALIVFAKVRVLAGGRLPRAALFRTHLFSAIPMFFGLSVLAFLLHPLWLVAATAAAGIVALSTGSVLWYRGMRRVSQAA